MLEEKAFSGYYGHYIYTGSLNRSYTSFYKNNFKT